MARRHLGLFVFLCVLAGLTLWPRQDAGVDALGLCLICGRRGVADALLNMALFLPLGLFLSRRQWFEVALWAMLLSGVIEAIQLVVPGRHPSPSDIVFNAFGALLGVGAGRISPYWIRPTRYLGDRMGTLAAILAAITLPLAAWLAEADLPDPPYRVEWQTQRPGMIPYTGAILASGIESLSLRPGPSARGDMARDLLEQQALFEVRVRAGPPPEGLAPLFGLYNRRDRTVALLAVDSTHLVYRQHTRASTLRLDNPDTRAWGALDSVAPGDTLQLATSGRDGRRCFLVGPKMECGHGIGGAGTWRFLFAFNGAPPELLTFLSAAWLAMLLFPVGYWARAHLALGLTAGVALYAWFRAPVEVGLVSMPPVELSGIAVGLALGLLTRRLVDRQYRPRA